MSRPILSSSLLLALVGPLLVTASSARASLWEDDTAGSIGTTAEWTNKAELADINGDGRVDILFANGGNYSSAGANELNRVFLNDGDGTFTEATTTVFGAIGDHARVIKVRDVDADGNVDIIVGTTYQTQSRLYLGNGSGSFTEVTSTHLPAQLASVGDLELGDVDGDGDLDMVLADWGAGNPLSNAGGRTMLWLGDGTGHFSDVTAAQMPDINVGFSWDLEFIDADNDFDLDIAVSCKSCTGSYLFVNDGAGNFTNDATALPQFSNNYEFEALDLNHDGALDMITMNDGPSLRGHVFLGDGAGKFSDATSSLWPTAENAAEDDNMAVVLDYDSDGDPDFLIGSLSGSDRLLINDGAGHLTENAAVFLGAATPGTLCIQVADLNGDARPDVVQCQGEVASPDKVYSGVDVAPDTAAPIVARVEAITNASAGSELIIRARVHDNKSPTMPHDWSSVSLRVDGVDTPMIWYGEYLWRASLLAPTAGSTVEYQVCAEDAAGNSACSALQSFDVADPGMNVDAGISGGSDAGVGEEKESGGCGCQSTGVGGSSWLLIAVALLLWRRRDREDA
jgi:MYXO-CTERM domain-containing protein